MQSGDPGTGTDPGCIQLSSILGEMGWFDHFHLENTAYAPDQSMQIETVAAKQTVPAVHHTKRGYKKRNAAAIAIVAVAVTAILTQLVLTVSQKDDINSSVTDAGDQEMGVASIDDMQQKRAGVIRMLQAIHLPCMQLYLNSRNKSGCRILIAGTNDPHGQWIQPMLIAEELAYHVRDLHIRKLTVYGQILRSKHPMLPFIQKIKHKNDTSQWQLGLFITSVQKACLQVRAEALTMQQLVQKDNNNVPAQVEFEDLLVPNSMCTELLPEPEPQSMDDLAHETGNVTKAGIARSILHGASRATLGTMLL
jgi:hypothetical protein